MGQITSTLAGAFQENKGFAIANAVMNVAEGVTRALTLPFPLNWAQAGAVTAAGAAQIAAISSARPGGSGRRPSVGGGNSGAISGGGSTSGAAPRDASPSGGQAIHLTLIGHSFSREQVASLAGQLMEYQKDGGRITLNRP